VNRSHVAKICLIFLTRSKQMLEQCLHLGKGSCVLSTAISFFIIRNYHPSEYLLTFIVTLTLMQLLNSLRQKKKISIWTN
jgi:4-amino-4-deoxy-L-arabinose transferase-like glycosyltransferase